MEFEIDFGSALAGPAPAPAVGPLYASVDGTVAPLSAEECAFQVRGSDAVHVMTLDVLKALEVMHRFEPLPVHYERIEQALPALRGKREAIERVVGFLVERGLVVRAEALLAGGTAVPRRETRAVPLVIVRTCDRPEALGRLLRSLLARTDGPRPERILVIDDSRDAACVAANRETAAGADGVIHLDAVWRARLVDRLAEAAPELERPTLEDLLLPEPGEGFSGGAALNAGLLLAAGEAAVFLDDDMAWEPRLAAGAEQAAASVAPAVDTPLAFLREETSPLRAPAGDWLADALAAAGRPLAEAAAAVGSTLDPTTLRHQERAAAQRLLRAARVRTVQFGYYGDSCMDTRLWLYLAPPAEAAAWWTDRSAYFGQLERPRLRQGYGQPQVGEIANFTPAVIDGTRLVPPAAPRERGEDLVLTAFLRFLDPCGVNLNLPVLLSHERPGERPPENPDAFLPWASRFFAEYALAHADECEAATPEGRLAHLARRFEDLADADDARLAELLREFLGFMRARVIQRLQGRLAQAGQAPDYFRNDLRAWIEANGRALTEARPPRLRGWPDDIDTSGCVAALRRDAAAFAHRLRAWPRLWAACRGRRDALLDP